MYSVLIPLTASPYDYEELRFSLRSIEKFLPHLNVVIVGEYPNWLRNCVHIPASDKWDRKQENIRNKILLGCESELVSDPFLFSNDDIFFLKPMPMIEYWSMGTIRTVRERGARPLEEHVDRMKLPDTNFDIHYPILYEKEKFKIANGKFSSNCIIKSSYCNYWGMKGTEIKDLKINIPMPEWNIWKLIEGHLCFSVGDEGYSVNMRKVLNNIFPSKSKFEC